MSANLPPEEEIKLSFAKSSGPGGQSVNKVNSKVALHWNVHLSHHLTDEQKKRFFDLFKNQINEEGVLQISSQSERSQKLNIEDVLRKLKKMIQMSLFRPKKRLKTRPSRSQNEKRLKSKKLDSLKKRMRKNFD